LPPDKKPEETKTPEKPKIQATLSFNNPQPVKIENKPEE